MLEKLKATITAPFDPIYLDKLKKHITVSYVNWFENGRPFSVEEIQRIAGDADILVTEVEPVNERTLSVLSNLKLVVCARGTPVNIDIDLLRRKRIELITTPGRNARSVAELTLTLVLIANRQIDEANRFIKSKSWKASGKFASYITFQSRSPRDLVIGLVGFGAVGKESARLLRSLGSTVIFYDPYVSESDGRAGSARKVDFDTLLSTADIISIHCVLNEQTRGLIGLNELAKMKRTAAIINTARAGIVDQASLLDALRTRTIQKAYLDVYETEPLPDDDELFGLDNVFLLPHVGGCSQSAIHAQSEMIYRGIMRFLKTRSQVTG